MRILFYYLIFLSNFTWSCHQVDARHSGVNKPEISKERKAISKAALDIVNPHITYNPDYFTIPYPNGDIPANKGVCTDVIIRTYRKLGIDLQEKVHIDMQAHFDLYPKRWGLKHPDTNIDHRRVPNLMNFFSRFGKSLPASNNPNDYQVGDIVVWDLGGGVLHIGIIAAKEKSPPYQYRIVHNIGNGQVLESVLFNWKIIGHYYYAPDA